MTVARRTRRNVLLIAGGIGITPMRALFEAMPAAEGVDVLLLYRARSREEVVFRAELDAIATRRRIRVICLLGDNRDHLACWSLLRLEPDLSQRDVYLCGSPGMAGAVRVSLADAGLPSHHLHEERFVL